MALLIFHWSQQLFHNIVYSMCFLKTLKPLDDMSMEKESVSDLFCQQQTSKPTQSEYSLWNSLLMPVTPVILTKQDQLLFSLMNLVNTNNAYLHNISQKLSSNEQFLSKACQEVDHLAEESSQATSVSEQSMASIGDVSNQPEESAVSPLVAQLFGKKKYLYRLQLQEAVQTTIFKERNINILVNLVDMNNQKVMNSNIIHLCLGVCDANAQWITQNRSGESFMKGKTEAEIYHGQGSFLKVYPRDVSRGYSEGKINFVVYSKASMLKFSSNASSVEKVVDSNLIQPLLISDISIRAKKKE